MDQALQIKTPKKKKFKINYFYVFVTPWLVSLILFTVIPMLISLVLSFTNAQANTILTKPLRFIGLMNYTDIFENDPLFLKSIGNSFLYAFLKVTITIIVAFFIALLLNKKTSNKYLSRFYKVCIYLPSIIPAVSNALLWQLLICQDKSFFVNLFASLGLGKLNFRSNPAVAMMTVTLVNVIGAVGPWMIVILSALQNVPNDLLESANLDGSSKIRTVFSIILPVISPQIFFLLATGFINTLQAYAEITLLFGSNESTYTMTMRIMDNAFANTGMGYACAMAWVVFGIVSIFSIIFFKTVGKKVYYGAD